MSIGLMALLFFVGLVVFFFLLGKFTPGSGADLVDWDPVGKSERRRLVEHDDLATELDVLNRRRKAMGLEALREDDVLGGLQRSDPDRRP